MSDVEVKINETWTKLEQIALRMERVPDFKEASKFHTPVWKASAKEFWETYNYLCYLNGLTPDESEESFYYIVFILESSQEDMFDTQPPFMEHPEDRKVVDFPQSFKEHVFETFDGYSELKNKRYLHWCSVFCGRIYWSFVDAMGALSFLIEQELDDE